MFLYSFCVFSFMCYYIYYNLFIRGKISYTTSKIYCNHSAPSDNICGICFENNSNDKYSTSCKKHFYHKDCLVRWLVNGKGCPMCRTE